MKIELKVPEVGESVQEALLAQWLKKDGEPVHKDEIVFVIETDKVTLDISAPADGILRILIEEGRTVAVGTVVGTIDTAAEEKGVEKEAEKPKAGGKPVVEPRMEEKPAPPVHPPSPSEAPAEPVPPTAPKKAAGEAPVISAPVRTLAEAKNVDLSSVVPTGPGGRITEGDVLLFLEQREPYHESESASPHDSRDARMFEQHAPDKQAADRGEASVRKPMSPIRQRIAARLLEARNSTAMLTTFNEIDMSHVQTMRAEFGEDFRKRHGIRLGIMSFFLKASVDALQEMPEVNAFIDGKDIVYHNYYHIGVAVGAERGLVVPVIRNVDRMGFADLEKAIVSFVEKIDSKRLELSDLEGGTFTITNGGVFGSLLSTPILNPPQSAILGLHKIEDRPVVVGGQVVVRPMMYVALSYDHRIIDGREAVFFLRRIKECIENPERIMMEI
jgi:2-oxoglutarate dehydrogenase E2 component (dihydrolipoamide succinyltransferase)